MTATARPLRLVLDTCVCLDLFHFEDRRCASLREALDARAIEAVTSEACRDEWLRVLGYPQFGFDEERRARLAARFDAAIRRLSAAELPARADIVLPRCRDRDDQKFLELARDAGAAVLVTKDNSVLRLGRRVARAGLFTIVLPEALTMRDLLSPRPT